MYAQFKDKANVIYVRLPHIFLATIGIITLFRLFSTMIPSTAFSILGIMTYVTLPENLVGLCAEKYTAATNLFLILLLILYVSKPVKVRDKRNTSWIMFWMSFCMGLINSKAGILPLSMLICAFCFKSEIEARQKAAMTFVGFLCGTLLFCLYGAIIDLGLFVSDSLQHHGINRFLHLNDNYGSGYHSIIGLWKTFISNHGILFCILAFLSIAYIPRVKDDPEYRLFAIWFAVGAFIFSVIDCRLTYHLLLIILPLILGLVLFLWKLSAVKSWRWFGISALTGIILRNIWVLYKLSKDFYYIPGFREW